MSAAVPSALRICAVSVCSVAFLSIPVSSFAADQAAPAIAAAGLVGILQVLLGLGLVLAAIAGTAWLLRKFSPGQAAASGSVRVVGGVAVGPKERVVLVDVGETRLVLGVAPGHVGILLEMPRPAGESATISGKADSGRFYTRLKEILYPGNRVSGSDDAR